MSDVKKTAKTEETAKPEKPYSYHTFIFPFLWNENGKVKLKTFQKCLSDLWEVDYRKDKFDAAEYTRQDTEDARKKAIEDAREAWCAEYARWCYFNQAARSAIFTEKNDTNPIVVNYRYNIGRLCEDEKWLGGIKDHTNPVEYRITKDFYKEENNQKILTRHFEANLKVNAIRLRLFTTGVGMLVFELENYEKADEQFINEINEYGRRVFSPHIESGNTCSLCADCLSLRYPSGEICGRVGGYHTDRCSEVTLAKPLLHLLSGNGYTVTTNVKHGHTQFHIEPIIDDRMFVACFYINKPFADEMIAWDEKNERYQYLSEALSKAPYETSTASRLYKLVFVDGNGISCHNRRMLYDLLEKHMYTRWVEMTYENDEGELKTSGSFIGITEYSMVGVGDSDFVATTAFLPLYTEMAMLVLAQRASLLSFERQISDSSRGKLNINRLQNEYVKFQSRLLLREVTPQQQGIELYDMLLKNLFIDKEKSDLESQITALFAEQTGINERDENIILAIVSALGVFDAVALWADADVSLWIQICATVASVAIIAVFLLVRQKRLK